MEIMAIIPARGGSKGIPRKNLIPFNGKPLIVHSIEQALTTARINRVVVSTDNEDIKNVSIKAGAEVIDRPAELSDDFATSESALKHTLEVYRAKEDYSPDWVVFLQATSPLREENDIANAIDHIIEENADSLFSSCLVHGFLWRENNGGIEPLNYDKNARMRRQDCPEDFIENGSIYIFRPEILMEQNNRLGGKITHYQMGALNSFQIDEPQDVELFQKLTALMENNVR